MRALTLLAGVASIVMMVGCGTDIQAKVACTATSECLAKAGNLFEPDADSTFFAQCCAGFCVMVSPGCDSGLRYLTSEPAFGACATGIMCPAPPDMSTPADMTAGPDLGGTD